MLLGHGYRQPTRIANQSVHQVKLRPGHHRLLLVSGGSVLGHKHLHRPSGPGAVGGGGSGGIPRRGHGKPGNPQLGSLGDGGGNAPRLKGAGGIQTLFLDKQALQTQLLLQVRRRQQGSSTLAQGDYLRRVGYRHQFGKAPHIGFAAGINVPIPLPSQPGQVIAGKQHFAAAIADLAHQVMGKGLAALGTFQVVDIAEH